MQTAIVQRPDGREVEMLFWSDFDLFNMSQISEADQRRAMAYWRRRLPAQLKVVVDAKRTTEG